MLENFMTPGVALTRFAPQAPLFVSRRTSSRYMILSSTTPSMFREVFGKRTTMKVLRVASISMVSVAKPPLLMADMI